MDVVDATFEAEVMTRSEQVPVVVDLWAPWCGPCKSLGPILERVVAGTEGRVVLAKVDIDQNPGVAQAFGVQSIPAVFAIHHREVAGSFVGAQGEDAVNEFVTKQVTTRVRMFRRDRASVELRSQVVGIFACDPPIGRQDIQIAVLIDVQKS